MDIMSFILSGIELFLVFFGFLFSCAIMFIATVAFIVIIKVIVGGFNGKKSDKK